MKWIRFPWEPMPPPEPGEVRTMCPHGRDIPVPGAEPEPEAGA